MKTLTDYAKHGLLTIPIAPKSKSPFPGFKTGELALPKASKDKYISLAEEWQELYKTKNFNQAVITGDRSGVVLLDVDGPKGITALTNALKEVGSPGPLPVTPTVITGRAGGYQLYFKYTEKTALLKTTSALLECVDIRNDKNGYALVPPSIHPNGKAYKWDVDIESGKEKSFENFAIAEMPDDLLEILLDAQKNQGGVKYKPRVGVEWTPLKHGEGEGIWKVLNKTAQLFRQKGYTEDMIVHMLSALQECGIDKSEDVYPESDLRRIAKWYCEKVSPVYQDKFDLSDTGYRDAFLSSFPNTVKYTDGFGFLVWNGRYWERSQGTPSKIYWMIDNLREDLIKSVEGKTREEIKWARVLGDRPRKEALIAELKAHQETKVDVPKEVFDTHRDLLCVGNGVLNLETGELDTTDTRKKYLTMHSDVDYKPNMSKRNMRRWVRFLLKGFGYGSGRVSNEEAKELYRFFKLCMGYSITGHMSEQVFFQLVGYGSTGKGTLMNAIRSVLGSDLMKSLGSDELMLEKRAGSHTDEISQLDGSRVCDVTEIRPGSTFNESLIRSLTGQNTIQVRKTYGHAYDMLPTFKIWIQGNELPGIKDNGGNSTFRRFVPIPMYTVVGKPDTLIEDKLGELKETILLWLAEGARDYYKFRAEGKAIRNELPKLSKRKVDDAREDMDSLGSFLGECFEEDVDGCINANEFYRIYKYFARDAGLQPRGRERLVKDLRERPDMADIGYGKNNSSKAKRAFYFKGLALTEEGRNTWRSTYRDGELQPLDYDKFFHKNADFNPPKLRA